ncbi:hypothetical protein J7T55_014261 [Diaporthe amygdali]|uniref:uncharacterized protein n=1 Tax=Phomopsis amygdali TaxID=1214568 RepID=UPI0022FEF7B4|nr:uncharacterized protein J7T55_014261 [Diaporthe amygdali]KAJ0109699.1 hypothetical protein J7T55_014261 [Diaporthe amygdali]
MRSSLLSLGVCATPTLSLAISNATCKCFPGESCWPSTESWESLNATVGGRLIETVPLARSCHDPQFDNATCSALQSEWQSPSVHMSDPSSVMAPFFANQSCDPFTAENKACDFGSYVRYAVNVSNADDVAATIAFAKKNDIRFVIRNTGHDYLGRSTGAGSLSVWTHYLKDIEFLNWNDANYTGSAVKVGAGVQGYEILAATKAKGLVVVGGECPTVGIAGGYTQGGGHSALSTSFGLSADNVLEWEAVTADGQLVTASRSENPDLYWALSGGGAGNYAVVTSMTVKTFPDTYVGAGTLAFYSVDTTTDAFYEAIDAFHNALPAMVDAGSMVVYYFTSTFFQIAPLTAYNKTAAEVKAIMAPFIEKLNELNVTHTASYNQSCSYYKHYDTYFGPLPVGAIQVGIAQYGARLIPRSVVQGNSTALNQAARAIAEQGVTWIGVGTDVSRFATDEQNAVLPAWRKALVHATLTTVWSFDPEDWDQMLANQQLMTDTVIPTIEAATPGSGAYLNEGDFQQPNFQDTFFGSKYESLLGIKKKYDPSGLLYSTKAVGSESWKVSESGQLCRA